MLHADHTATQEILEPARRADDEVAALGDLLQLRHRIRPAVDGDDVEVGLEAELPGLDGDLLAELSRGCHDNTSGASSTLLHFRLVKGKSPGNDGHQEGRGLPAAGLRSDHHIGALQRSGHGVFLHRGRIVVPAALNAGSEDFRNVELLAAVLESTAGLLHSLATTPLDFDVVILVEVYPGGHLDTTKQKLLFPAPVHGVPGWHPRPQNPPLVGEKLRRFAASLCLAHHVRLLVAHAAIVPAAAPAAVAAAAAAPVVAVPTSVAGSEPQPRAGPECKGAGEAQC
mmetsp:Transcript_111838/g.316340  ORF Transcript_111838/g.316340 Transcript_111838/m.316340 type:complete len:284 (-) Transcript_111838:307-1158(-)